MINQNSLSIQVYAGSSTTPRPAATQLMRSATVERFTTFYQGGIFGTADITLPFNTRIQSLIQPLDRIVIMNGRTLVFEGRLSVIGYSSLTGGLRFEVTGYWGDLMQRTLVNRRWCDTRVDSRVWPLITFSGVSDLVFVDRTDGIKLVPKSEEWAAGAVAAVGYNMPEGEVIERIECDYELDEDTQNWKLQIWNATSGVVTFETSTTGSGSFAFDLTTPPQSLHFRLVSNAASPQTPPSDGSVFAAFTDIRLFGRKEQPNLSNIAKDLIADVAGLNSTQAFIDSNTQDLEPFITTAPESVASILRRATDYGDSSGNAWAAYLAPSADAQSVDGKPVLVVEQYPSLDTPDYFVDLEAGNVEPFDLQQDASQVVNNVVVTFRDLNTGDIQVINPDTNATLRDADSEDRYGVRYAPQPLSIGTANGATALAAGEAYLASHKEPQITVASPVIAKGYVFGTRYQKIPASQVRSGKVVRIKNLRGAFNSPVLPNGLSFVITATEYTDETKAVSMEAGSASNAIDLLLKRRELGNG